MSVKKENKFISFLVVDDFGTMRRIITGLLKQLGYSKFTEADNGLTALSILDSRASEIDFVVTDWTMPDMDGITLLKKIRSSELLKHLPVLMVTAEGRKENIVEAAEAGADGYVVKPFNALILEEKINKILDRRRSMGRSDISHLRHSISSRSEFLPQTESKSGGVSNAD